MTRPCAKCGRPIDPLTDSYTAHAGGLAHIACPADPALPVQDVPPAPASDFLTLLPAAALLGCHPSTLRKAIKRGDLPAFRIKGGKILYLRRQDLLALLEPVPARMAATLEGRAD